MEGLELGAVSLELRHLAELQLDRGLPAEDVDEDLDLELFLVDLDDLAGEVGEGAFLDPDRLALLVLEAGLLALALIAAWPLMRKAVDSKALAASLDGRGAAAQDGQART